MWRFLSDAGVTLASHAVSAIGNLAVQVFVARNLSLDDYGKYSILQAVVSLVEAIFVARSGEVALYTLGRVWANDGEDFVWWRKLLAKNDFRLNILIYLLTILLSWSASLLIKFDWKAMVLMALTIPLQIGYGVSKSVFVLAGHLKEQARLEMYMLFFFCIAAPVLTSIFGLIGLMFAIVAERAAKTILARRMSESLWPKLGQIRPYGLDRPPPSISLGAGNIHSVVRNTFLNAAQQGDIILVSIFRGEEAAGIYKVAKSIANLPIRAVNPLWYALRPKIVLCIKQRKFRRLKSMLNISSLIVFLFGCFMGWPVYLLIQRLILIMYGQKYEAAGGIALVLLVGTWVSGATFGWLSFACVMSSRKALGAIVYFLWCSGILIGGVFIGKNSGIEMALVVAVSMIVSSVFGWWCFAFRDVWEA